jgi:predicted DNA-binding protein (MmcQ/YjbR family)
LDHPSVLNWLRMQPDAVEGTPFGPDVLVYKVGGKMFAATPSVGATVTLKCDPDWARALRAEHPAVAPGYHLNKRHWNTVRLDGSVPSDLVLEMLEHSYTLVVDSLPRAQREGLRSPS